VADGVFGVDIKNGKCAFEIQREYPTAKGLLENGCKKVFKGNKIMFN